SAKSARGRKTPAKNTEICPDCGGTGILFTADGESSKCPCGAFDRARLADRIGAARLPKKYLTRTLETFAVEKGDALRASLRQGAMSFADTIEDHDRGLLLRGVTGCGKTHIAVGILHRAMDAGFSGLYCNVTDLLTRLRASYSEESL